MKPIIAVWFSCGAASAVAAYLAVKNYSETHDVRIYNTPIDEEDDDNLRFKKDVEKWIGVKIETVTNKNIQSNSAEYIWKKRKYMAGVKGAPCTSILKKETRYQIEKSIDIDFHVLGFTFDEKHRHERFIKFERANVIPILIDNKITKTMCFDFIKQHGITLPNAYKIFSNANCIGCVKASGVDYWQRVKKHYPEVFEQRSILSRQLNCKLIKYKRKRLFLDELTDDMKGRKSVRYDCGLFCDKY